MSEIDFFLDDVKRWITAPRDQRIFNKTSCRDRMRYMDNKDVTNALQKMNLKELQYCMGCGIPGSANTIAIQLVQKRKKEYEDFLELQSRRAAIQETNEQRENTEHVIVPTDDNTQWSNDNEETTHEQRKSKALYAFESGRKSNL